MHFEVGSFGRSAVESLLSVWCERMPSSRLVPCVAGLVQDRK